jgi:SAM-dependent methyltransferase
MPARWRCPTRPTTRSSLVLHFVPDPQAAVREMARATAPGGTVAAYVWNFAGEGQFTGYFWRAAVALDPAAAGQDPSRQCALCHAEPLAASFTAAGLQAVTVQAIVVPIGFRDFDDYWRPHLMGGSSPAQRYVASRGEGPREVLRERVHTILPIAGDGSIPLLGHLWAVRGTT